MAWNCSLISADFKTMSQHPAKHQDHETKARAWRKWTMRITERSKWVWNGSEKRETNAQRDVLQFQRVQLKRDLPFSVTLYGRKVSCLRKELRLMVKMPHGWESRPRKKVQSSRLIHQAESIDRPEEDTGTSFFLASPKEACETKTT